MEIGSGLIFAPVLAIFAILIANPLQFIFDLACMFLFKFKSDKDSAKQNCILLFYQISMVLFISYLSAHCTYIFCHVVKQNGRKDLLFLTFLFAYIADQVKSVFMLSCIYLVVVRRFGYLKENEKDFIPQINGPDDEVAMEKKENAMPQLKGMCLKLLEH